MKRQGIDRKIGRKKSNMTHIAILLLASIFCLASSFLNPAHAANISWTNAAGGSFHDADNWNSTVPGDGDRCWFQTNGIYTLTFTNNVTNQLMWFNANDATVTVDLGVGREWYMSPGYWDGFEVSRDAGTTNTVTFLGGSIPSDGGGLRVAPGANSQGSLTLSNVAVTLNQAWSVANGVGSVGELHLESGSSLSGATGLSIGWAAGSTGTVIVSDSTLTYPGANANIGRDGGHGILTITNNGVADFGSAWLLMGWIGSSAELHMHSGTFTAEGVQLAQNANGTGTFSMVGGTISLNNSTLNALLLQGDDTEAVISGGTLNVTNGTMQLNNDASCHISGGNITVGNIRIGNSGGKLTISGGNLESLGTALTYFRGDDPSTDGSFLKIIGTNATITLGSNYEAWDGMTTIFLFKDGGVTPIQIPTASANLDRDGITTLTLGMAGYMGAITTNEMILFDTGVADADNCDSNFLSIFTAGRADSNTKYVARLDPAYKDAMAAIPRNSLLRPITLATNAGWVSIDNGGMSSGMIDIHVKLDYSGATSNQTQLLAAMAADGLTVYETAHEGSDLITIKLPAATWDAPAFAWDFRDFDAGIKVEAIGIGELFSATPLFYETFEDTPTNMANNTGSPLAGQHGWEANDVGTNNTAVQTAEIFAGSKAGSVSNSVLTHDFTETAASNVWIDFYAMPPRRNAVGHSQPNYDSVLAFYVNSNGNVVATSGGTWAVNASYTLTESAWYRFTANVDYDSSVWSLYIANGTSNATSEQLFDSLGFRPGTTVESSLSRFYISADNVNNSFGYFDDFTVGNATSNSMPRSIDADEDGYPDRWEISNLGGTNVTDIKTSNQDADSYNDWEEYVMGTDPRDSSSYMKIMVCDLSSATSSNITLSWLGGLNSPISAYSGDTPNRQYQVMTSDNNASNTKAVVATMIQSAAALLSNSNTWTDVDAVALYTNRYYNIVVSFVGTSITNTESWAMHRQDRDAGERYMVCVPVDYQSSAANNLDAVLGAQLGRGLYANDTATAADRIKRINSAGGWDEYYLSTTGWRDYPGGAAADLTVSPGMTFWVTRGANAAERNTAVFTGKSITEAVATNYFTINTNYSGWNMFGWPLAIPRNFDFVDYAGNTPADQLGFVGRGAKGGTTTDPNFPTNIGDQIWIYSASGGWDGYYLVEGGAGWEVVNGRWLAIGGAPDDFVLEPGEGYYYYHPTSNSASPTNFTWSPENP